MRSIPVFLAAIALALTPAPAQQVVPEEGLPFAGVVVEPFDNGAIVELSYGGEGVLLGLVFIYGVDNGIKGQQLDGHFFPAGSYTHTAADDETEDLAAYALTKELAEQISARESMGLD